MKKLYTLVCLIALLCFSSANATIRIINSQSTPTEGFIPNVLNNVVCGDTIRWVNTNGVHTTASTTIPVGATAWSSGNIPLSPGFYSYIPTVIGTYNYICHPFPNTPHMGASFIVTSCPSSVTSIVPSHISFVYPNPFNDKVTIQAESFDMVMLYNVLGENVKSISVLHGATTVEVNTAELSKGIYLFAIMNKGVIIGTRKLVKN